MKKYRIIHIPSGEFSEFTENQLKGVSKDPNVASMPNKEFVGLLTAACWYGLTNICEGISCNGDECPWGLVARLEYHKLEYIIEELND